MSYDRQCSSCGGFCGRGGCKREHVKVNKQREALEKALLALEIAPLDHNSVKSSFFEKRHYAIIALREALAEPEPKPVVWIRHENEWVGLAPKEKLPITTSKPDARKPLTDEQISAIVQSMSAHTWDAHILARAIERAHGIQ